MVSRSFQPASLADLLCALNVHSRPGCLAGLFSSCVEAFGYFKASQCSEEDLEILLVKLDIEKTRLLVWGNTIGILNDGRHHALLEDESTVALLERCLKSIEKLLTDSDELRRSYGKKFGFLCRRSSRLP